MRIKTECATRAIGEIEKESVSSEVAPARAPSEREVDSEVVPQTTKSFYDTSMTNYCSAAMPAHFN